LPWFICRKLLGMTHGENRSLYMQASEMWRFCFELNGGGSF
jgi:hypothetical protein